MKKLIRVSTVPISLNVLLRGQLSFLNKYFEVIGISSAGKDLAEVETRENVKVHSIEIKRKISLFHDFISLFKLYLYFKKEKPFIVHSITPKAGLLSMIASWLAGVPIRMHTFTGLIFPTKTGFMQKILIKMDQLLCMAATNIYPEGEGVKGDLIRFGITSKPLKVLANGNVNGIDINHFSPETITDDQKLQLKADMNINLESFIFIFVGRLVTDKGVNELVEAFSNIKFKDAKLILVGPFENELDPLKSSVLTEISANPNIITVGFQSDIRPFLAIASVMVFPSYREGFPNVVLQAGAMGLPCIVTNISGSNEIITDGLNGIIIDVRDTLSLEQAMNKFISDKNYAEILGDRTREIIISRFEQSQVWKALLSEYTLLIEKE